MKRWIILTAGALFALNISACSKPSMGVSSEDLASRTQVSGEGDYEEAMKEGQAHWEKRESEDETLKAIEAWEDAVTFDTGDKDRTDALFEANTKIAAAYYWLAHGHHAFIERRRDRKNAQQEAYQKCMDAATLALSIHNKEWNAAVESKNVDMKEAAQHLQKADVPAAYWYSTCAGKWATLEGIAALLAYKDKIFEIVTRIAEIDDNFYYRATDRYFGVVYTKLPFMNPDLDRSEEHFRTAINAYPEYLESRVLYTVEALTKTGDTKEARKQLEYVVNADPAAEPKVYAENLAAQRHAQDILDNFDEHFN